MTERPPAESQAGVLGLGPLKRKGLRERLWRVPPTPRVLPKSAQPYELARVKKILFFEEYANSWKQRRSLLAFSRKEQKSAQAIQNKKVRSGAWRKSASKTTVERSVAAVKDLLNLYYDRIK